MTVELAIPDVPLIKPDRFSDDRGWLSETYNQRSFKDRGLDLCFRPGQLSLRWNDPTIAFPKNLAPRYFHRKTTDFHSYATIKLRFKDNIAVPV
jgi:dTDP-4-dehydrorhamnose 3,5-epimerase